MNVPELQRSLAPLHPLSTVAVDEGGLTLVEVGLNGQPTGAYLEIGGIPE